MEYWALWNQEDLIALREEYGVHQVKPGLTGLAQISGRDELEIEEKALLDRAYVEHLGFHMDVRCFFGTFLAVLRSDGVVEGGTGAMEKIPGEDESRVKEKTAGEVSGGSENIE